MNEYNDICPDCGSGNYEISEDDQTYYAICLDCGRRCVHEVEKLDTRQLNEIRKSRNLPDLV